MVPHYLDSSSFDQLHNGSWNKFLVLYLSPIHSHLYPDKILIKEPEFSAEGHFNVLKHEKWDMKYSCQSNPFIEVLFRFMEEMAADSIGVKVCSNKAEKGEV